MANADHYFHGDACKWTGKTEEHYGISYYVYEIIEGYLTGKTVLSMCIPRSMRKAA